MLTGSNTFTLCIIENILPSKKINIQHKKMIVSICKKDGKSKKTEKEGFFEYGIDFIKRKFIRDRDSA